MVVSGGLLGPVLLLVGLERMSAVAGSMLLNLEGPFTVMLAVLVFREHLGRYGLISTALILLGAGHVIAAAGFFMSLAILAG